MKVIYQQIECPVCGNTTTAKSVEEPQKCKWCRRLFKVKVTRRNKEGSKKAKYNWEAEPVDFEERPRNKSIDDYIEEDIYGC